jgi:hypothetical protein
MCGKTPHGTNAPLSYSGRRYSITHMDGPENPDPTTYSTRPYGRFGAFLHRRGHAAEAAEGQVSPGNPRHHRRRDNAACEGGGGCGVPELREAGEGGTGEVSDVSNVRRVNARISQSSSLRKHSRPGRQDLACAKVVVRAAGYPSS